MRVTSRIFSIFAGVLYLLLPLFSIESIFYMIGEIFEGDFEFYFLIDSLWWTCCLVAAIFLFIGKRKLYIVPASLFIAHSLFQMFANGFDVIFVDILNIMSYIVILVFAILYLCGVGKGGFKLICLCWIPVVLTAISEITFIVELFDYIDYMSTFDAIYVIFSPFINILISFFVSFWLTARCKAQDEADAKAVPVAAQPVYQQPVYAQPVYQQPVYQQPVYQQPVQPAQPKAEVTQSVIDEIKKAKELLDAGAITQEEFDTIKSNLMNK